MKLDKVDKIILEAIDETLSILGDKGKESIYYFFEKEYLLSKQDIPSNLKKFHECLQKVFGIGANVLEKHLLNILKNKTGIETEMDQEMDFVEKLENLRTIMKKRISMV
ncbi:MAG: hypothetical protein N3F64_07135 [Nitrososphaeria archaeon]|nr:hypothetical protein [Nitrososphaeria archaeon]